MRLLSYILPRLIYKTSSRYNKKIEVKEINGRYTLLVNGIEQTGNYTQKLWRIGLQPILHRQYKNILIFGVGGGGLFHILNRRFRNAKLIGVDIDDSIINIAKNYFGLDGIPSLTLIRQDARSFRSYTLYDLVIVDLYIGNDVPEFVTKKTFLLRMYRMLAPNGQMVLNYYNEFNKVQNAAKIASLFTQAKAKSVLRNIFVYVIK